MLTSWFYKDLCFILNFGFFSFLTIYCREWEVDIRAAMNSIHIVTAAVWISALISVHGTSHAHTCISISVSLNVLKSVKHASLRMICQHTYYIEKWDHIYRPRGRWQLIRAIYVIDMINYKHELENMFGKTLNGIRGT